jgi:hypothetical protein
MDDRSVAYSATDAVVDALFHEEHRDGVRLLARRAPCGPDAQRPLRPCASSRGGSLLEGLELVDSR